MPTPPLPAELNPSLAIFLRRYFSHPYWLKQKTKYLRVAFSRSAEMVRRLQSKGYENPSWFIGSKVFTYKDFESGKASAEISWYNKRGANVYYYPNVSPIDCKVSEGRQIRDSDIVERLYCCIDWDNQLPVGVGKILSEFGLVPELLIRTSSVEQAGFEKYQSLLGFFNNFVACDGTKVCREVAYLLGGDTKVSNAATLMRLPGWVNWKSYPENKVSQVQVVNTSLRVADRKFYNLRQLETLRSSIATSPLSESLIDSLPKIEVVRKLSPAVLKTRKGKNISVSELPSWDEAIGYVREGVEPFVPVGVRHNSLVAWAGELLREVGRGVMGIEMAEELLCELAHGAVVGFGGDEPGGPTEVKDVAHLNKIIDWLKETHKRDMELRKQELENVGAALVREIRTEEPSVQAAEGWGGSSQQIEELDLWTHSICRPTAEEQLELEKIRGAANGSGEKLVQQSKWLEFLVGWLEAFDYVHKNSGMTREVVNLLVGRIKGLGLITGPIVCTPAAGRTVWGEEVKYLSGVVSRQARETFIGDLLQELCVICGDYQELLICHPRIKKLVVEIREAVVSEQIDGESDTSAVAKEVKKRLRGLLRPVLTGAMRDSLVKGTENTLFTMASLASMGQGNHRQIVFQNGVYDVESGDWIEVDDCYRRDMNCLWVKFDSAFYETAKEAFVGKIDGNRRAVSKSRFVGFLKAELPKFWGLMESSFPSDPATWLVVLNMIGYCLLKENPFQYCFNLHGITRTGKTTLASLIVGLVGESNAGVMDYEQFGSAYEGVIQAVGKTVMFVDEAESNDKKSHLRVQKVLKQLTSGKKMSVRGIYRAAIESRITAKIIMTTNEPLSFDDSSGAMARRMAVLKFDHQASNPVPDYELEVLRSGEATKLAALGTLLLWSRWKMGGEMFGGAVGSRALNEGAAELGYASDKIRAGLQEMFTVTKVDTDVISKQFILSSLELWLEQQQEPCDTGLRFSKKVTGALRLMGLTEESFQRIWDSERRQWSGHALHGIKIAPSFSLDFERVKEDVSAKYPAEIRFCPK